MKENSPTLLQLTRRVIQPQPFLVILLCASSGSPALAQAPTAEVESPIALSPFEVNVDKDKGFVASSSLAGGRLAGELKDTPVAYSVLTRDFIDALQLTNLTDMTKWAPNSYDIPDNGDSYGTGNEVLLSSRGVSSNSPQRDFFPVSYNFDGYNIERLDLARGPNAVLFGSSGVGGTTNSVTKRARVDRSFNELRFSAASWDNYRVTLDTNIAMNQSVAIRANILFQDRKGWQDLDAEKRVGATLATTLKPLPNTEVRLSAESYRNTKAVITTNFDDNISGWNGTSVYNAKIAAANNAAGINRQAARTIVFTPTTGLGTLINYEGWAITQGGAATAATPAGGTLVVGSSPNILNSPITEQVNLPSNLYGLAVNGSHFRIPSRTFATTTDVPLYKTNVQEYNASITQRIGDNLFMELAGNYGKERTDSDLGISRSLTKVFIDVNSTLPNGVVNPNFLELFSQSQIYPYRQTRENKNVRAGLGYVIPKSRWGNFSFNLLGGVTNTSFDRNAFRYVLENNPDPRQWPSFAPISYRYYLNTDRSRPLPEPSSWTYIDPVAGTTQSVPAGLVRDYSNTGFNQLSEIDYRYVQGATSAKLFRDRLILLGAVRRDSYKTHQDAIVLQFDNPSAWNGSDRIFKPAAPADWTGLTYRERDANGNPIGPVLPADTRPRTSGVRDPRYANDRFRDDYSPPDAKDSVTTFTTGAVLHGTKYLSLFGNYAESFVPPSQAMKIDGSLFRPQTSQGWDYGLRFTFLNGGIVANISRYQGKEANRPISAGNFALSYLSIIPANALNDLTPSGLNSRGLQPLPLGYVDSASVRTEGYEMEITANPTKNWRITLNGALPKAFQTNPNKESLEYYKKNETTLRQIITDAGGSIDANDVATFTAVIPPGQSPTEGPNAVAAWNTLQATIKSVASQPQKLTRLTEATVNIFTDYTFSEGGLRGIRIGAGANYRGRQVIGYKGADTIQSPTNPAQAIDNPKFGALDTVNQGSYATAVMTLSYTRRFKSKYIFGVDLKVDNVFDYDKPIYYSTILRPAGGDLTSPARVATPYRYTWIKPRNYTLTTSVKF